MQISPYSSSGNRCIEIGNKKILIKSEILITDASKKPLL